MPVVLVTDSITVVPEFGGNAGVDRVLVHLAQLPVFDFPGAF